MIKLVKNFKLQLLLKKLNQKNSSPTHEKKTSDLIPTVAILNQGDWRSVKQLRSIGAGKNLKL